MLNPPCEKTEGTYSGGEGTTPTRDHGLSRRGKLKVRPKHWRPVIGTVSDNLFTPVVSVLVLVISTPVSAGHSME